MIAAQLDILGIFPGTESIGGVQASGRDAWRGIVNRVGEERARLLSYETGASKTRAALRVFRSDRSEVLLVWHLHLIRLVPFLRSSRARIFVFLHGVEAWKRHDAMTRWALRKVYVFLSNSDHTWERFLSFNPEFRGARHKTVHLGAGAQFSGVTPEICQRPAALMVGRMNRSEDYKGHREMIEAWPLVLEHLPDAELWIVGNGDLRPDLERLAKRKGLDKQVRFWGAVSDAQKEQLIGQCRCLVLPSHGEGFGLVYLEAMRMGRPCLVSDVDAGREMVNPPEAGLAANSKDRKQVAEATCRLLAEGAEWNRWSDQSRRRYESRFTEQHFQERLVEAMFSS